MNFEFRASNFEFFVASHGARATSDEILFTRYEIAPPAPVYPRMSQSGTQKKTVIPSAVEESVRKSHCEEAAMRPTRQSHQLKSKIAVPPWNVASNEIFKFFLHITVKKILEKIFVCRGYWPSWF